MALDEGGSGIPAGGRDDRAALRGSAGVVCWRIAAAGGGLAGGIGRYSSGVLDRNAHR